MFVSLESVLSFARDQKYVRFITWVFNGHFHSRPKQIIKSIQNALVASPRQEKGHRLIFLKTVVDRLMVTLLTSLESRQD